MSLSKLKSIIVFLIMVSCFIASFFLSYESFTGYVVSDNYLSIANLSGILLFLAGIGVAFYFFNSNKRFI